jgi:hypothetical protein
MHPDHWTQYSRLSIGGLLGICMGFSFITVAEVFFYSVRGIKNFFCAQPKSQPRRINRKINALKENDIVESKIYFYQIFKLKVY